MGKTIILVHGRSFKPGRKTWAGLWEDALAHGLERDHPGRLSAFRRARKALVYYGDISNRFLRNEGHEPPPNDLRDRRRSLALLKAWGRRDFNRRTYKKLPHARPYKEFLADTMGEALGALRLSETLVHAVAPDMRHYWDRDSAFGTEVRFPLIAPLKAAMDRGDRIMVIAHSLGSMIAYDTFWKFCYMGEYRPRYTHKKIDTLVTLGSPLADATVKRRLFGGRLTGDRRFPNNIRHWVNFAAEDDYISHDQTMRNDYRYMLNHGLVESIRDVRIYNLAVRHGKSNPHSSAGYLVHPELADLVAGWV